MNSKVLLLEAKKVNLAHPMGFFRMGKCPAEKYKAETNLGWGSHLRGVTWLSEALGEI